MKVSCDCKLNLRISLVMFLTSQPTVAESFMHISGKENTIGHDRSFLGVGTLVQIISGSQIKRTS